ncbi:MAG: hypothetical protein KDH96_11385 [Candidatus Riesia sp.]|nr:hypothetical protein [Candidatus Riesia sp.]
MLTDKGDGVIMTIRDNNIYNVYIEGANPPIVVVKGNEIIKSEFHDEYL